MPPVKSAARSRRSASAARPTTPAPVEKDTTARDNAAKVRDDAGFLPVNRVDAVLRDPDCPGDVRATVAALAAVDSYLNRVEFVEGPNGDGYLTVRHPDPDA